MKFLIDAQAIGGIREVSLTYLPVAVIPHCGCLILAFRTVGSGMRVRLWIKYNAMTTNQRLALPSGCV
jgi:hypothetical protein